MFLITCAVLRRWPSSCWACCRLVAMIALAHDADGFFFNIIIIIIILYEDERRRKAKEAG